MKETPLLDRIYQDPVYAALCRAVGYKGIVYRELLTQIEGLAATYGKSRVESASWHLVTFEGQRTTDPKPLAAVTLRAEVRRYCFMLLGPPPEAWDAFYRNPDGTPGPRHAEKMAELDRPADTKPEGPKKSGKRRAKANT